MCSRHHALVNMLLDICLSFGLVYDASRLLETVLLQAFIPESPHSLPPITHPAHTTYLVDLHARWTGENAKQSSVHHPIPTTTAMFCRAVLSTLSGSGQSNYYVLCSSRSMNNLVCAIARQDVGSLVLLIHGLVTTLFLSGSKSPLFSKNKHSGIEGTCISKLRLQFLEWMVYLWDKLAEHWEDPELLLNDRWLLVEILTNYTVTDLHNNVVETEDSCAELPGLVASFATSMLVHHRTFKNQLLTILNRIRPTPATYAKLAAHLWQSLRQTSSHVEFELFSERSMSRLKMSSSVLRSQNFLELDASLWACALRQLEEISPKEASDSMAKFRRQLMDAVELAEQRYFGSNHPERSPSVSLPSRFKGRNQPSQRKLNGHWEWEEMVGCWVRKTPLHKKPRLSGNDQPITHPWFSTSSELRSHQSHRSIEFAPRIPKTTANLSYALCDSDANINKSSSGSEDQEDKENYPTTSPLKCTPPSKKPRANFRTLIADAYTNRVVLHANNSASSMLTTISPSAPVSRRSHVTQARHFPGMSSRVSEQFVSVSSDDLDLFAHRTSPR